MYPFFKQCLICNSTFEIKRWNQTLKKFCSISCANKNRKGTILVQYNEEELIRDYASGVFVKDIIKKHNIMFKTYYAIIKKLIDEGRIIKRQNKPLYTLAKHYKIQLDDETLIHLYYSHTYKYMCDRLNISKSTLSRKINELIKEKKLKNKKPFKKINNDNLRFTYIEFTGDQSKIAKAFGVSRMIIDSRVRYLHKKGLLPEYKTFVKEKLERLKRRGS